MSVWDDLKSLFDGVVDTNLPPGMSTGDSYVDDAIRKLINGGNIEAAIEVQKLVKNAQEVRTMERVQQRLNEVDGLNPNEIFDVRRDFSRGGLSHAADSIRDSADSFPNGIDVDELIGRAQQAGFAQGDEVFERAVSRRLEETIDDFRFRTTPPANDEREWDPERQQGDGSRRTPDDRYRGRITIDPPANDNIVPRSALRWLGRGLKTILPPAGAALAAYAVYEILNDRGNMLDKLNDLQQEGVIDSDDYTNMRSMIDNLARLRGLLEGVGNLPGVNLLTGVAVDTLGQREVNEKIEEIETALAAYRETHDELTTANAALGESINAARAARDSIEESLRDIEEGDLGIEVPEEAENYIEVGRDGRLQLKEGVESPEAQQMIDRINREINQLREGGDIEGFMNGIDDAIGDAEREHENTNGVIEQLDRNIKRLEEYESDLIERQQGFRTLSSVETQEPVSVASLDDIAAPTDLPNISGNGRSVV